MNLLSGKPYWPTTFPDAPVYPPLSEDANCDVLIVGAGSSGALCAYLLSETGLRVIVVDKRKAGQGSTMGHSGFVQLMGDKMWFELAGSFGQTAAVRHAKLSEQAIRDIDAAARNIPIACDFVLRDSVYTASSKADVDKLKRDEELLVPNGFQVDWWSECAIEEHFPFSRPAALYCRDDAELNPYKFTLGLLGKARERGVTVYENTPISGFTDEPDAVVCHTTDRRQIRAQHAIIAAGYESLAFKQDNRVTPASAYALITEPIPDLTEWYRRALLSETARPYTYMRTTPDNRIMIGGWDAATDIAADGDAQLRGKTDELLNKLRKMFPSAAVRPAFYLGTRFGGTRDGLPMLGQYAEMPRRSFLYANGGNRLVHGMMLAGMLRDELIGTPNADIGLYRAGRQTLVKSS